MSSSAGAVNKQLHVGLFLASCFTTFFACFVFFGGGVEGSVEDKVQASALYALVVMGILLAHELGHFFMAKAHGVDASWPYFIPLPLGFGTLGAVIRLKSRIPTRDALVDVGAAGPLAGLLIAVPMLFVGVSLSHVDRLPEALQSGVPPTLSLLNLASHAGLFIRHLLFDTPAPVLPQYEVFGDNLLTWFAVRVIHGELPAGSDLMAHPVFLAAWFGLVMTMLNLLPVGQLDGGHLTHAWYGEEAEAIGERIAGGALLMALFFSASWLVWFFLITRLVGLEHPPVAQPAQPLSRGRKVVVVITWVMTGLTFMPVPLSLG
jgi:membrane-associated protease RseP (regulator of RpoE activity)